MEFSTFTFAVTEECNFSCSYCFQKKGKGAINVSTIEKALDFFLPLLTEECYINFYGGEPLLSYDKIRHAVTTILEKNKRLKKHVRFSMTTNGSLINDDILEFLNQHKFLLTVSFDGLAQDISKKKGSFEHIVSTIRELLRCPDIDLETNSVFTSDTIQHLSESIKFILKLGVSDINFSVSVIDPWDQSSLQSLEDEITKLRGIILSHYQRNGYIPVVNFREENKKGIFYCAAGQDRLAVTPEGKIWGCYLFPDYFYGREALPEYRKYFFGGLDSFSRNHKKMYPRISKNYARLSMDNFSTPRTKCLFCSDLESCTVCPVNASFSESPLGKIPSHVCEIQKIFIRQTKAFRKDLRKTSNQ